ncbi:MAG: aldo/keto reductase [Lachnoclostridium sp.]|nr:aldo/keto reductase [Lachnospira sp.]MCM1249345.1 aldo/keto reductase [Lachnoclostridium sp.]
MKYRPDRYGNQISQLGYGCMRFSKKGNGIDYEKAEKEVLLAIENGVNYFDTAYIYPGSEECLGRILDENKCRDRVYIATKLPQYIMRSAAAIEKTFQEELSRLRTDHIDYYLMHMFTDYAEWEHLKALGIEEWIKRQKAEMRIRNIGFSYHGDTDMFLKILDAYDWDFCQIQYNYLDEHTQAGRKGLQAAAGKGIPVIIMEPLRGGKLVNLPEKAKAALAADSKGYTPAELGLRWLWDQPEVSCVLSGMNSEDMINENIRIASEAEPGHFTEEDRKIVEQIKAIIREREKVGCTGCRYCMPCPKGVDIPGNFYYYNLMYMEKKSSARFEFAQNMGMRKEPGFASQCVGCGQCEKHCPQHISIREKLKEADHALRPLPYKIGIHVARKMIIRKT